MDNQFRNAAFGGFNRQDVMDYLERTAKEHNEALEELRTMLAAAEGEREELRTQLAQAQEREQELTRERDDCCRELEQVNAGCQTAQERSEAQADRLTELEQENEQLRQRVAQLEPGAAAYDTIKERTAGMELDAHRRAQAIVDQAKAEAGQTRRNMEQWLERIQREYSELSAQVDATVSHAAGELERARQGLERVSGCLDSQSRALEGLTRTFDADSHE